MEENGWQQYVYQEDECALHIRAIGIFFMVIGLELSATMAGRQRKNLKLHWIKCPKTVPLIKTSYLEFINFRFSGRTSQRQQKLDSTVSLRKYLSFYKAQLI